VTPKNEGERSRRSPGHRLPFAIAVVVTLVVVGIGFLAVGASTASLPTSVSQMPGGDPTRGRDAIVALGCGSCHVIPGVEGARGEVGPALDGWAGRSMIAGRVPNTGGNLIQWLLSPDSVDPGTDMPNLGLSPQQAKDVAAYLYTLR
jgi:cytochrome c